MITLAESGLTTDQYNAIVNQTYNVSQFTLKAMRYGAEFSTALSLGTGPWDTVASPAKVYASSASAFKVYDIATDTWSDGNNPSIYWDKLGYKAGTLYAVYENAGSIYRRTSTDGGSTWSSATTLYTVTAGYTFVSFTVVEDMVYICNKIDAKNVYQVFKHTSTNLSINNLYYPYPIANMSGCVSPSGSHLVALETEVPGPLTASGSEVTATNTVEYWEQVRALIVFDISASTEFKDIYHWEVDLAFRLNNPDNFSGVNISLVNGQVFMNTLRTRGVIGAEIQNMTEYQSYDGHLWSIGSAYPSTITSVGKLYVILNRIMMISLDGTIYTSELTPAYGATSSGDQGNSIDGDQYWELDSDFTIDEQGWSAIPGQPSPRANYVAGVGWRRGSGGSGFPFGAQYLQVNSPDFTAYITTITLYFSGTVSGLDPAINTNITLPILPYSPTNTLPFTMGASATITVNGTWRGMYTNIGSNTNTVLMPEDTTLTRVVIRGKGLAPKGATVKNNAYQSIDLTGRVTDISFERSSMQSLNVTMTNADNYLSAHDFIGTKRTIYELYLKYDGASFKVGTFYSDGISLEYMVDNQKASVIARDSFSLLSDYYKSEDFEKASDIDSTEIIFGNNNNWQSKAYLASGSFTKTSAKDAIVIASFKSDVQNFINNCPINTNKSANIFSYINSKNYFQLAFISTDYILYSVVNNVKTAISPSFTSAYSYTVGMQYIQRHYSRVSVRGNVDEKVFILPSGNKNANKNQYDVNSSYPQNGSVGWFFPSYIPYIGRCETLSNDIDYSQVSKYYASFSRIKSGLLSTSSPVVTAIQKSSESTAYLEGSTRTGFLNQYSDTFSTSVGSNTTGYVDFTSYNSTLKTGALIAYGRFVLNGQLPTFSLEVKRASNPTVWVAETTDIRTVYTTYGDSTTLREFACIAKIVKTPISGDTLVAARIKVVTPVLSSSPVTFWGWYTDTNIPSEVIRFTDSSTGNYVTVSVVDGAIALNSGSTKKSSLYLFFMRYFNSSGTELQNPSLYTFVHLGDPANAIPYFYKAVLSASTPQQLYIIFKKQIGLEDQLITFTSFLLPSGFVGDTFQWTGQPNTEEIPTYITLDPGESPLGGLQRAIDGRYVLPFSRFDGSIVPYVWTDKISSHTFPTSRVFDLQIAKDTRELHSHVRMLGAYVEAEYIHDDLIPIVGHRFTEANNPYLMTESECYAEAKNQVRRMLEASEQASFRSAYHPFLEPEDRITIEGRGDWIINSITPQMQYNVAMATYSVRRWVDSV